MIHRPRAAILLTAFTASLACTAQAAPSLHFDTVNGTLQLAGINALQIADSLYDVRWDTTLNYYDTFSLANPLSPTFMNNAPAGNAAAAAIAAFINSVPSLPASIGFQPISPNAGISTTNPRRFIGMIPTSYTFNTLYSRWESNGPSLQFTESPVLDAGGTIDPTVYRLTALTGGFGAITNETGPGGRGIITANPGWAFIDFNTVGTALNTPINAVPEPALATLLASGLSALGLLRRRRK